MESRAKLFGHPVHPMLVVLPLGLFIMAVVMDIAFYLSGWPGLAIVAFWNILGGIAGGLLAAIFGLIDWIAIPDGTRAKAIGLYHGAANLVVLLLFAISAWLRYQVAEYFPSLVALSIGVAGLLVGAVSGWLGGELVDRLGVGVDDGAHLDAPNSLSGRPARDRVTS